MPQMLKFFMQMHKFIISLNSILRVRTTGVRRDCDVLLRNQTQKLGYNGFEHHFASLLPRFSP
jgi:hypothetical protein